MTLDRYADLFDDDLDDVADRLDRLRSEVCGPAADYVRTGHPRRLPTAQDLNIERAGQEPVEGVETRGIEPLTPALQRRCSAN